VLVPSGLVRGMSDNEFDEAQESNFDDDEDGEHK
jgi:hypothetical protein